MKTSQNTQKNTMVVFRLHLVRQRLPLEILLRMPSFEPHSHTHSRLLLRDPGQQGQLPSKEMAKRRSAHPMLQTQKPRSVTSEHTLDVHCSAHLQRLSLPPPVAAEDPLDAGSRAPTGAHMRCANLLVRVRERQREVLAPRAVSSGSKALLPANGGTVARQQPTPRLTHAGGPCGGTLRRAMVVLLLLLLQMLLILTKKFLWLLLLLLLLLMLMMPRDKRHARFRAVVCSEEKWASAGHAAVDCDTPPSLIFPKLEAVHIVRKVQPKIE